MAWRCGTLGMDDHFYWENYGKKDNPVGYKAWRNTMVWKMGSFDDPGRDSRDTNSAPRSFYSPQTKPQQEGTIIAQIGAGESVSRRREDEWIENVYSIDNILLGYNAGRRVLLRCPDNERAFEMYVGLPFTKGMTERGTGRTMLIIGSDAHHGEVMTGQYDNVLWNPQDKEQVSYGDLIRWINVGAVKDGFIGLDYNPAAGEEWGVARSRSDIAFLAERLMEYGYDAAKKLFLLKPPHIVESADGHALRREGYQTLADYVELR